MCGRSLVQPGQFNSAGKYASRSREAWVRRRGGWLQWSTVEGFRRICTADLPRNPPPSARPHPHTAATHTAPRSPLQPSHTTAHTPFNNHPHHPHTRHKNPPSRNQPNPAQLVGPSSRGCSRRSVDGTGKETRDQPHSRSAGGVEFAWMFPKTSGRDRHGDRGHLLGTEDMKLPVLSPQFLSQPPANPPVTAPTGRRTRHPRGRRELGQRQGGARDAPGSRRAGREPVTIPDPARPATCPNRPHNQQKRGAIPSS